MAHDFFSVLMMIVVVAGITTVVVHGSGAADTIKAFFSGFAGAINAAQ